MSLLLDGQGPAQEQPPFSRKWLSVVLAAWAVTPVLLWQNLQIPQAGAENQPGARSWVHGVVRSWEPEYQPQQGRRYFPQVSEAAADSQPFRRLWLDGVVASWNQELAPVHARRLAVQAEAAPADSPPFGQRAWLQSIRPEPEPILLWKNVHIPESPAGSDPPPFGTGITVIDLGADDEQPRQARRFVPQEGVVAEDRTPYARINYGVIASWTQEYQPVQARRFVVQVAAVAPDDPPFGVRAWLQIVRQSWEPAPYKQQILLRVAQAGDAELIVESRKDGARWPVKWKVQQYLTKIKDRFYWFRDESELPKDEPVVPAVKKVFTGQPPVAQAEPVISQSAVEVVAQMDKEADARAEVAKREQIERNNEAIMKLMI